MKKNAVFLFLFFYLIIATTFGQTKKPIVASDLMKIATAGQLQISPDGGRAVMAVTRKAVKNDNEYYYTRHLYVLDLTGKAEPRQLTFGERLDNDPQWSPDGKTIAFVRADGDKQQVWLLPLDGGEAQALTKAEYGAGSPRWSPDGKKLLYTSSIPFYAIEGKLPWTSERPGRTAGDEPNFKNMKPEDRKKASASPDGNLAEVRAWLAKNASESNPRVLNRQNFQGELTLAPDESFAHLFLHTIGSADKPSQLTTGHQSFTSAAWSPDGKKIICTSVVNDTHPDRERDTELWTVDLQTKTAAVLLNWDGYSLDFGQYAPDGSMISFEASTIKGRFYAQSMLATATATGAKPALLTQALDRDATHAIWSGDSKSIYFIAQADGNIPLYSIPARGGAITKLVGNASGVNDFDLQGDKVIYALTETRNPWEVYTLNLKDKTSKQLTKLNEEWLKERQVITPKEYWLTRPDGTKVQYWVMEPVNKKDGTAYPTILNIHGGPAAMWGPGIFSMWHEYQLENGWGYGVVYSNPRGSGGYGDAFKRANFKDWGTSPSNDILSVMDDAAKNNSWIDRNQLFVEGGSYAGYMVAWIVGHDNRFKAANAQRGVYDLSTFMGEGNAWQLVPDHFGGYPWEKETRQVLDFNSPMSYVNNINTPLLIIHGDQDLRTGVTQSEMLYKSLKVLNKPVEYIRYPKEGHELTRSGNPGRMMDHMLRVIEFFERYAKHPQ
jgi:dipeptidyl aminopeptidase/acylaminoacyl peptidase